MYRRASEHDVPALAELEQAANLVALRHVFPPERYPFPFDAVLARWRLVLDDADAVVLVVDHPADPADPADPVQPAGCGEGLAAYVAYDPRSIRHVAVHPAHWGEGLATAALEVAVTDLASRGAATVELWVLEENRRARGLYERLGWTATDDRRETPWPPHPMEMRYLRHL